jgi:hypothetical protein
MWSGRVSSSCSTSDTRRVNLVTNPSNQNYVFKQNKNQIISFFCKLYKNVWLKIAGSTYRILSVQLEGFGSSYICSCCSSSYLYVLVLYLTLWNTPYLLIRYLRNLGNDHVQLCFFFQDFFIGVDMAMCHAFICVNEIYQSLAW